MVDGKTYLNGVEVTDDAAFAAAVKSKVLPQTRAVIRADKDVSHGRVITVLDRLKQAGVNKIAFAVSPAPPSAAPALPNSAVKP
jgi:biopolymer transport protein ExbD